MKIRYYLQGSFTILIGLLMLSTTAVCNAEEITLTTYYPSPYGVYSEMRLYPKDSPSSASCQEGLMFYSTGSNVLYPRGLYVCGTGGTWQSIGGGYWAAGSILNSIYNTNPGNVGIGTNSPGQKLVVQAADTTGSTGTGATIHLQSDAIATTNRGGSVLFGDTGATRAMIKGAYETAGSSGYLALSTKTSAGTMTEALRINSGGNVGIGTTIPPVGKLEVNQLSTVPDPNIIVSQSSNSVGYAPKIWFKRSMSPLGPPAVEYALGSFVYSGYAGPGCLGTCTSDYYARGGRIAITTSQQWSSVNHGTYMTFEVTNNNASDTAEAMRIAPSGNIGIGTTSLSGRLHVKTGLDQDIARFEQADANFGAIVSIIRTAGVTPREYRLQTMTNGGFKIRDNTAGQDRILITLDGDVGIGIDIPTQKLDVNGRARFRGGIQTGVGQISALCSGTPPVSCSNTSPVGTWYESCALSYMGGRDGVECEIVSLGGGRWRIDGRNNIGTSVKCGMSCIQYY